MIPNLEVYRETDFSKGMNDTLPPEHLPKGFVADALNCFLKGDGIVKRTGYSLIGNDVGNAKCQGMKGVRFADGTKEMLVVFNGVVYKWTGSGNLAQLSGSYTLSTTADIDIVVANNNVYFFDGTNTVPKYNGTTMSTVAAIPIGSFARWFHNMMFVGGISGSPNNIQISALGDPETYSGGVATTISVNPNDGDYITGMNELGDELLIFKTKRVWSISGFGTSTLTLADLNERITGFGTLSHRSIVNIGNDVIYLSFLGDIPHFRSIKRTQYATLIDGGIVSKNIEGTMDGINKAKVNICAGVFDGTNLWYAVADGSSTTQNKVLMYDTTSQAWVRHSGINANCWDVFAIGNTVQVYFGEATADSKAYVFDTSTSDNGTAINFQVISRRYGGDRPEMKKKWKYLYVSAEESGNYDVDVDYAKDGFTYDDLDTLNLSGAGAVFDNIILDTSRLGATDVKRKRFNLPKAVAYYMQYKFSDTSATSSITIRDWETMLIPKGLREVN